MLRISESLRFKSQRYGHHMTKYGQNYIFGATNQFQCTPDGNFCQSKRLIGTMLHISENLRSKGHRPSSSHEQIWAKLQFWIHNSIQCTRWQLLLMERTYWDSVKHFGHLRVKSEGHQMIKYWPKCSLSEPAG